MKEYRVLDANANRAVEALRVIEDYHRFIQNNQIETTKIKKIRHQLTAILQGRLHKWRRYRNISLDKTKFNDMYRDNSTEGLILANFSRLKESIRVLEEYLKLEDVRASAKLRDLRFDVYDLEQNLLSAKQTRLEKLKKSKLYVLLSTEYYRSDNQFLSIAKSVVSSGADLIQFRDKCMNDRQRVCLLKNLRTLCDKYDSLLIINDRPDLCIVADCDGVHLGETDMDAGNCRKIIGADRIIGKTAHSATEIKKSDREEVDYISFGTFFASNTKPRPLLRQSEWKSARLSNKPLFAIGGISIERAKHLKKKGISRVAVCSRVMLSKNPSAVVKQFKNALS